MPCDIMAPRQNAASKSSIFLMASAVLARCLAYGSTLIEMYARAILSMFESVAGILRSPTTTFLGVAPAFYPYAGQLACPDLPAVFLLPHSDQVLRRLPSKSHQVFKL